MREKGKGTRKSWGQGVFVLEDKGLPLDREETDEAYGIMAVYKGTRETPMLG